MSPQRPNNQEEFGAIHVVFRRIESLGKPETWHQVNFSLFKIRLPKIAKEMGLDIGQVENWVISLSSNTLGAF